MTRYVAIVRVDVEAEDEEDAAKAVMALLDDPDDNHWQIESTAVQSVNEVGS